MGNERQNQDQERRGGNDPRTNEPQKRPQDNPSRGPGKPGEGGHSPTQQPPGGDPSRQREQQGDRDDDETGGDNPRQR
jgi:hypothetical protein